MAVTLFIVIILHSIHYIIARRCLSPLILRITHYTYKDACMVTRTNYLAMIAIANASTHSCI